MTAVACRQVGDTSPGADTAPQRSNGLQRVPNRVRAVSADNGRTRPNALSRNARTTAFSRANIQLPSEKPPLTNLIRGNWMLCVVPQRHDMHAQRAYGFVLL